MMRNEVAGSVIAVDKPAGPTSHDVVRSARRALGVRRVGHTGTLDPFASGLLLLCVGPATRLAEYLTGLPKHYQAMLMLGAATDSDDATGKVIATSEAWQGLEHHAVEQALLAQIGIIAQRPPAFSAKKRGGERLYRLARAGRVPALTPAFVEILNLSITEYDPPRVSFALTCSAGTYVRAVARDVGEKLGVPAHLATLRRTGIGTFAIEDAVALEALGDAAARQRACVTPLDALRHLPRIELDAQAAAWLSSGRAIAAPADAPDHGVAAVACDDRLIAIVECTGGALRPRKAFPTA